ncbi:competence protein ComEA [Paenibacillus sp. 5J-6]|uniref:Competence protein ComEA n=1 Tax=Paenibacillus silvestris TaxID=2606219 RepID=A0A6L8UY36_9BACL|nr:helix-hairpin-helix domain-containing protein [Paenibacillus silvestris]MZQ81950.1 competence protein ComEA [Paenibacillus silvestris]
MTVFRYRKFLYVSMIVCFVFFVVWPYVTGGRSSMIQTGFEPVNAQIEALIVEGEETALAASSASATRSTPEASAAPKVSSPDVAPATSTTNIPAESPSSSHGLLDLNTATLQQLNDLPGIGESKARAILDYRMSKGKFRKVEELTEVKGIGDKMLEKLKPLVYVTSI